MASPLSVGDIMLLSSLAWKIGCAFTSGRAGAPAEFREVENELKGLQASLGVLADTLEEDDSILSRADEHTRDGLDRILSGCRETLMNLDSLVKQYQEVRKRDTSPGATAPRVWKGSVIRTYKTLLWTSEGGNIQALRSMLQVHKGSISIMVEAIQSRSLARLENVVHPMANQVDGIHNALIGNIDVKIAKMHDLLMGMTTPSTSPMLHPTLRRNTLTSLADTLVAEPDTPTSTTPVDDLSPHKLRPNVSDRQSRSSLEFSSMAISPGQGRSQSWESSRTSSPKSQHHSPTITPYETPPTVFADTNTISELAKSSRTSQKMNAIPSLSLPQPAVATYDTYGNLDLPSSSVVPPNDIIEPELGGLFDGTDFVKSRIGSLHPATASEHQDFERSVFDHAMTLCSGTGVCVDYTLRHQSEGKPEENITEMVEAMKSCKISIVTKTRSNSAGRTRHITSIWALSNDRKIRLQQELNDDAVVIPYTVWGKTKNVVLRFPTELVYHTLDVRDKPIHTAKTQWVTYRFQDEQDAKAFQSALMWKRLEYSFCTRRTMLTHEGFVSATFSFQEQVCGLENLRMWRDEEESFTIAMIHYSPMFHDGYLSFRIAGPGTTAKAVDDGERWVKIKRLNIIIEAKEPRSSPSPTPSSPQDGGRPKKARVKKVSAIRIEFSTPEEKYKFLEVYGGAKR